MQNSFLQGPFVDLHPHCPPGRASLGSGRQQRDGPDPSKFNRANFEAWKVYLTLAQIEQVQHTLRDITSAHVAALNFFIPKNDYHYGRGVTCIILPSDSVGKWASWKAALERSPTGRVLKNLGNAVLV